MSKAKPTNSKRRLRILLLISMFSALSIVFGKFLAFNIGDTIRISFENLPILFAGIFLGPLHGMIVGVVADLVGCVLAGYLPPNLIVTLGAALIGLCGGLFFRDTKPLPAAVRIFIACFVAHFFGSVFMKTLGFIVWYGSPSVLFLVRCYYFITAALEASLLVALSKTPVPRALDKMLDRPSREKWSKKK